MNNLVRQWKVCIWGRVVLRKDRASSVYEGSSMTIRIQIVFCGQRKPKSFKKRMENYILPTTSRLPTSTLSYNFIMVSFSHFKQKRDKFIPLISVILTSVSDLSDVWCLDERLKGVTTSSVDFDLLICKAFAFSIQLFCFWYIFEARLT